MSVLGQSLTGGGGPPSCRSSALVCALRVTGSEGHSKAEESSREPPEAGYLETVPGRKKEAARVGGS